MKNEIVIAMSLYDALSLGLLICECGHKGTYHYNNELNCGSCDCENYNEQAIKGKIITEELCRHCKCSIMHGDECQCENDG